MVNAAKDKLASPMAAAVAVSQTRTVQITCHRAMWTQGCVRDVRAIVTAPTDFSAVTINVVNVPDLVSLSVSVETCLHPFATATPIAAEPVKMMLNATKVASATSVSARAVAP